jgi:hypothetical protein
VKRAAVFSGVGFALLFGVGNALWFFDLPAIGVGEEPEPIAQFYVDHSGAIIAGATMSLISIALFLVFAAVIHRALADADGPRAWLPTAALAGAVAVAGAGLVAESVNVAGALRADADSGISGQAAQLYFDVSQMRGFPAGGVGFAVFAGSVALVALRTGRVIPRWLALLTLPLALVSLVWPLSAIGIGLLPLWTALVALALRPEADARASRAHARAEPRPG